MLIETPSGPYQSSVQWHITEREGDKGQQEPVRGHLPCSLCLDYMQGPITCKGERNVENMQGHETQCTSSNEGNDQMSDERSVSVTLLAITSCHLHLVTVLQPTHLNTRSYALHWIY